LSKLNALKVQRASEPGRYGDGGNLYLQVSPGGGKSWLFRYRLPSSISSTGKPTSREMGLGSTDTFSLAQARELAQRCRQLIAKGIDPIADRDSRTLESAWTFSLAVDEFMKQPRWRNAKHNAQWRTTLETYAYPVIGNLPVAQVTRQHVLAILTPIWFEKNETASRVRGRIEMVLDWCKAHGHRPDGENPAAFKGNLAHALPAREKVRTVRHHPAMPHADLPGFMAELGAQPGRAARALRFTILTASRTGEVLGMRWREVDLEKRLWSVPAVRMKGRRDHEVPLSDAAVELLEQLRGGGRLVSDADAFVFAGTRPNKPISNMSMLKLLERMDRKVTVHGFRSTFRTWVGEATDTPREVAEMALAHVIENRVEAAYQRSNYYQKRVRLMEQWARFCTGASGAGEVIRLRG
jgi:integrase